MEFKLLTPDREVFSGEVELVGGRTKEGSFSLLPGHIPAALELEPATLKLEDQEGTKKFVVHGGFLFKERDDTVKVLTRQAWNYHEIDLSELNEQIESLEQELAEIDSEQEAALYDRTRTKLDKVKLTASLIKNE